MSGSTLGAIAGGAIGFFVGGPVGAQWGMMIGSTVGGYVDPEVIKGPQLGDIPVQTSQEGVPRPIVFGSPPPFPGNIIQIVPKQFRTKRERQGKGGPVVESQEVYQSYAIRICEGEATVVAVWRDGKVVFDRSGKFSIDADGNAFSSRVRFYTGDETQLPDATLEAHRGTGNQPAYRGTAYMVVTNDNLTNTGGRIPNYEFRMASVATVDQDCGTEEGLLWWYPFDDAIAGGIAREIVSGGAANGVYSDEGVGGGPALNVYSRGSASFVDGGMFASFGPGIIGNISTLDEWSASVWFNCLDSDEEGGSSGLKYIAAAGGVDDVLGSAAVRLALDGAATTSINNMRPDATSSYATGFATNVRGFDELAAFRNGRDVDCELAGWLLGNCSPLCQRSSNRRKQHVSAHDVDYANYVCRSNPDRGSKFAVHRIRVGLEGL